MASGKIELYPAQRLGVDAYLSLPQPRRFILPWKTGCGKTAAALSALRQGLIRDTGLVIRCPRTLIVCPAIVRRHWLKELGRWVGDAALSHAAVIEAGRHRRLPPRLAAERDAAYQAPIQIVSYDLLKDVCPTGWDMIILDELHHIASPLSKQSKLVRALVNANAQADILGLSATLIPTEVKQIWNPLRIFFGELDWGKPCKRGDVSWDFQMKYCKSERTEYGLRTWGLREDRADELRALLRPLTYPLSREDIIPDMPPLSVDILESSEPIESAVSNWYDSFDSEDVTHKVILVRHRALAKKIYKQFLDAKARFPKKMRDATFAYVDGSIPSGERSEILETCAAAEQCTLIGTHESLAEGVRLMWCQQAIIGEWSQSPGRIIQLLGRFNSIGSEARPQVSVLSSGDNYHAAINLIERTKAVIGALGDSPREQEIVSTFSGVADTTVGADDWMAMFESHKPEEWSEENEA